MKNEIIPDIVAIVKIFETVAPVHSSRLVVAEPRLLRLPLLILLVDDWLSLLIDDWLDYYDLRLLIGWIEGLILHILNYFREEAFHRSNKSASHDFSFLKIKINVPPH